MAKIRSLSEQVYDHIVDEIKHGRLVSGERINEKKIIEELGISRTPLREALILLASDNIVENVPRKGFFIKAVDEVQQAELYNVIACLDAYAISLAFDKIDAITIDELRIKIDHIDFAIKNRDYEEYCDQQCGFHQIYLKKCGNKLLINLLNELENKSIRTTYFTDNKEKLFTYLKRINDEHRKLLKAIENGNKEEAKNIVLHHWSTFWSNVKND